MKEEGRKLKVMHTVHAESEESIMKDLEDLVVTKLSALIKKKRSCELDMPLAQENNTREQVVRSQTNISATPTQQVASLLL